MFFKNKNIPFILRSKFLFCKQQKFRMFELVTFEDYVKIEPVLFNKDLADSCRTELNRKLANKVYQRAGLCICMHDILKVGDSAILPGEGLW